MDFRLLGPFDALVDGRPIQVGTRRQERLLLAVLLLAEDRVVPTERLIDLLWDGTSAPRSARAAIHTYVGRLRQTLAPYGVQIVTQGAGYVIEAGPHTVDATRFADLARRAGVALDPTERIRLLGDALGLWRGPFLADLVDDGLRDRLGGVLLDLRLTSCELWAETRLAMGEHAVVLADLMTVAAQYPTRERLVGLLMTALYRAGRQAEAIERFQATRVILAERLGVQPGPELQTVYLRVLRNDPDLDRPPAPVFAARIREQWLPWKAAGHPALEFCNTYAGWNAPRDTGADWLLSYHALVVWAEYLDLADDATVTRLIAQAEHRQHEATTVLDEARRLRTHLYTCLTEPDDAGSFAVVARHAAEARKASHLVRDRDGLGQWRLTEAAGLRLPLYAAANSAADLLCDPRRYTVRRCPGVHCGWLYLDPSHLRQWCSMDICGRGAIRGPDARQLACI
jgi:DNA-binding SARP family transcriptional activator/predicted RNA-binding Zn ribbon-like protein